MSEYDFIMTVGIVMGEIGCMLVFLCWLILLWDARNEFLTGLCILTVFFLAVGWLTGALP